MDRTPPGSNRRWLVARRLEGNPEDSLGPSLFSWKESPIPTPADGQALVRNLWLSFDPTQIFMLSSAPESGGLTVGAPMWGLTASQVVESRRPGLRRGNVVHDFSGWEDYSLIDGHGTLETTGIPSGVTPNLALGTLGVYRDGGLLWGGGDREAAARRDLRGLLRRWRGRIHRRPDCEENARRRVVGIAGGKEKCERVLRELRFDAVIDYRTSGTWGPNSRPSVRTGLMCTSTIPGGRPGRRTGAASFPRAGRPMRGNLPIRSWSQNRTLELPTTGAVINGRMEGLLGKDYAPRFPEATPVMLEWLRTGQLQSIEDVETGLERAGGARPPLPSGQLW